MINEIFKQKAIEVLALMNAAITNLRLYPPSSAMIINTIGKLHEALAKVLEEGFSLNYAESEHSLLINGEVLSGSDAARPQVRSFLELLLNFGIKSITFEPGLEKDELTILLQIIGKKPETVKNEGGLDALLKENNLAHIIMDKKIYIAKDERSQLIASLDIKDDEIIRYLTGSDPDLDIDASEIKDRAKDSNWLIEILEQGITEIMKQKGTVPSAQLSENLLRMLSFLEKVVDKSDQDKIAQLIAKAVAELDAEMIGLLLSKNMDNLFEGKIFHHVLELMDEEKIAGVIEAMRSGENDHLPGDLGPIAAVTGRHSPVISRLMMTDKGQQYERKRKSEAEREKSEKEQQRQSIQKEIASILRGEEEPFLNRELMASIPGMLAQLRALEDNATADALINATAAALLKNSQHVRAGASAAFVSILYSLPPPQQRKLTADMAETLSKWIRLEPLATSAYQNICHRLGDLAEEYLRDLHLAQCFSIVNLFHLIDNGVLEKNDTAHTIASDIVRQLGAPDLLEKLFEEFQHGEAANRDSVGRILGRLGDASLNWLLDLLRDHDDSNERVRILHIFEEIGKPALPVIRERIKVQEPWYFLRNIAYILGRIKDSTSADVLKPLLLDKNEKVRQEALKSLLRAGEDKIGPVLLSILGDVDEPFKMDVVEALGKLKYAPAVPALLELLKTRPLVTSSIRIDIEEKICHALGRIGSRNALPALVEIVKPKGFLTLQTYHGKVKSAAAKALAALEKGD